MYDVVTDTAVSIKIIMHRKFVLISFFLYPDNINLMFVLHVNIGCGC
jgi:hypothetical protein